MFEACVTITLIGVVAMQWFMSVTYQERFEKIGKLLKKIQESKVFGTSHSLWSRECYGLPQPLFIKSSDGLFRRVF